MAYDLKTNNYEFFEVSSAFQKSIRRGDEDQAMFWAVELHKSGFGEYAWKRMLIMVSEDIGLGTLGMPAQIKALYDIYTMLKKKKDKNQPERLQFTHAVLMLVRAKKSRLVDWAIFPYFEQHEENLLEIPDFAYDVHTQAGRKKGRGMRHFFDESSKLENFNEQDREEEYKIKAFKAITKEEY